MAGVERAVETIRIERSEAKYLLPTAVIPAVREFLKPHCRPDPHGAGDPAEYLITTLQLDTPTYALHAAKELEAYRRVKLRVRTYGRDGRAPIILEVKCKTGRQVSKSRATIPFAAWGRDLVFNSQVNLTFKSDREYQGFLRFVRIVREIGAEPVMRIRYRRESYFGVAERYARVSMDRQLCYQPATTWDVLPPTGRWIPMDDVMSQGKDQVRSGVVLELKSEDQAPRWMLDLVQAFRLVQIGNCKYSSAVWAEAQFHGFPRMPFNMLEVSRF